MQNDSLIPWTHGSLGTTTSEVFRTTK